MLDLLDEEELRIRLIIIDCVEKKLDEYGLSLNSRVAFYLSMYMNACEEKKIDPFDFAEFVRKINA